MNSPFPTVLASIAVALMWPAFSNASPPRQLPPALHTINGPGVTLAMDGSRVLARMTPRGTTVFTYERGRIAKALHSDGRITTYHYTNGMLDRITLSNGTVQTPIYEQGELAVIASTSGKRLGLSARARNVDRVARTPRRQRGGLAAPALSPAPSNPDSPQAIRLLNQKLIAIENWEAADWECTLTPEGEQICVGREDRERDDGNNDSSGDDNQRDGPYYEIPEAPPPEGEPSGGGSGYIRPDLDTLESCLAAANYTWVVMRYQFCPIVKNQELCLKQNYRLYEQLQDECKAKYR